MTITITVSGVVPAAPKAIYDAWLDGKTHARMVGCETATASTKVGGKFTAWDGYIAGRNLILSPGKRIVQSWRSTEFTPDQPDSQLEVKLEKVAAGTKVTIVHSDLPEGGEHYGQGWKDHYLGPMKAYFSALAKVAKRPSAKAKAKRKPQAKRKVAKAKQRR